MHRPPATRFSVQRSARLGVLLACLGLLSFCAVVWAGVTGFGPWRVLLLTATWLLSVGVIGVFWHRQPVGHLRWDGEQWHWSDCAEPLHTVAIQFDFQSSLWVTLRTHDRRRIPLWLDEKPHDVPNWRALRCALVGAHVPEHAAPAPADSGLA